ncbi:hypothetical protein ACFL4B_03000 [Candidatus Neomarinimicrobiota bacterium]
MKKIITHKNILILPIILSGVFIYNCTSDQNLTGSKDRGDQALAKINVTEIAYEVISQDDAESEIIEIQIAPNILNLQNNGVVVTVHTDIPFSNVIASTVYLSGIEIHSWKTDSQGFFVAKFDLDEVKALFANLEIPGEFLMTLEGSTSDGTFSGSEDILVIDKTGK